ncbi:hypothetical protein [Azospirillum cavernae]|uniref:hypothetical protein n=1 Tax=Azospirillum cavernae TaxID=2320860 RepID=UPI0011C4A5D9|nr:hypothetical protein [Azospirillum cavernae]
MANKEIVEKIQECASDIISDKIENLVHNPEWGKIDFEKAIQSLERLQSLVAPLKVLPLDILPQRVAEGMLPHLQGLQSSINRIRNFSIVNDSPTSNRDNICHEIEVQIDNAYPIITPHIPFMAYARADVQRNIEELVRSVEKGNKIVSEARSDFDIKRSEIDNIVAAAREASVKAGVAHFTHDFNDAAEMHGNAAKNWLIATGIIACLTAIFAFLSFFIEISHDASVAFFINRISSKLVFLGLFLAATIWCGRLYKAAKHQEATNRHRANALKTFQAFVQAAGTEPIREAILMETTRSIFAITPSGYLDSNDVSIEGGAKVVEVVKNITQAASSKV